MYQNCNFVVHRFDRLVTGRFVAATFLGRRFYHQVITINVHKLIIYVMCFNASVNFNYTFLVNLFDSSI